MASKIPKAAADVYRGYMPIGLPQHRPPQRIKPWWKINGRPRVTIYPKQEPEEFSEEPEYPPLNDATDAGLRRQIRLDWYDKLKTLPTAEQKMHEIDKHATHYMAHINNWMPASNTLPLAQYLTQTRLIQTLPDSYKEQSGVEQNINQEKTLIEDKIRDIVLSQIALDHHESIKKSGGVFISKSIRDGNQKAYISNGLVQNIVNQIRRSLAVSTNQQLFDYHLDLSPAIRSWWYHSGFPAPNNKVFYKSRKDDDGNINTIIQCDGSSALNLRSDNLIEPIVSMDDPLVTETSAVEKYPHPLKYYGATYKFKWPVALPGFWFEKTPKYDCPHTCFLTTDCLSLRNKKIRNFSKSLNDDEDCLTSQAILTAYSWLNSLSVYHGFTPFQELDYPLTCQVVTTDGQNWLFNVYQLNAHTFHRDLGGPSRNNLCWSSGLMKLYDVYENGEFKGINNDVVRLIIRNFSQKTNPAYTASLNLRPYLGQDSRTEEEQNETMASLRRMYEGRTNRWLSMQWQVPLFEHIFFRAPISRGQIKHMKPYWHIPKPKYPRMFE